MNKNNNIFGCFVSITEAYPDANQKVKDLTSSQGDLFRTYIWSDKGICDTLKKLNNKDYMVFNTIDSKKYPLLGGVHTHNKVQKENIKNVIGTSDDDKYTSNHFNIPIYAIDSWNFGSKAQASINRVTPNGIQSNNIGKTQGAKGDGTKTVNIGQEVLNYKLHGKVN